MTDSPSSVHIEHATHAGHTVLKLSGDVDLRSVPQLRESLADAIQRPGQHILIDLSGVPYMDSSGVGTLVFIKREVERRNGTVALVGLQPRVRGVFEITHLDAFFEIYDSLDEATAP